jgi:hypothetical protein
MSQGEVTATKLLENAIANEGRSRLTSELEAATAALSTLVEAVADLRTLVANPLRSNHEEATAWHRLDVALAEARELTRTLTKHAAITGAKETKR